MPARKEHVVTSALVIAKDESGQQVYLYQGSTVPSSIPTVEIHRLVDAGYLTAVDESESEVDPVKVPTKTTTTK